MNRSSPLRVRAPLQDSGTVEFASDDGGLRSALEQAIAETAEADSAGDRPAMRFRYENGNAYLRLMSTLQRRLAEDDARRIGCRIRHEREGGEEEPPADSGDASSAWRPLSELFGKVGGISVPDYILYRHFTLYMQPIVRPSGEAVGYELLTRPMPDQTPFRPSELFEIASRVRQHGFLDRAARQTAIRMGAAHLPPGFKRFVNFLPSSLHRPDDCLKCTFDEIRSTGTDPGDCVFEVVESEPLDDPRLPDIFEVYRREGIRLAIDDVGSGFATLGAVERLQPDYVKMDRRWISRCDEDPAKQKYIDTLLDRVSRFHGVVLAEGVERPEEWTYLKKAGVPLFQGYLFGRAKPVPSAMPAIR